MQEKRRHARFEIIAQIRARGGQIVHVLEVINLSRGGALIELGQEKRPAWVELGRRVDVSLCGADAEALFETQATIVRIEETFELRAFAVEFAEEQDAERIHQACLRAGRPPPLPNQR